MKMQTGIRVESDVWQAYRALCSKDRVRPGRPIEEFLETLVENGSVLSFLTLMKGATKTQPEGINAYAQVLLSWYKQGKRYFHALGEDDAPVEGLLLEALKTVSDSDLRKQIQETLTTQLVLKREPHPDENG
ncbi:MAG TPA: hypothetical protein VK253_03810 [Candidatus Binatia bacterium]|nr:hypothetical protein [Candidatus Binatia bacterium]